GVPSGYVNDLLETSAEVLWAASTRGLLRIESGRVERIGDERGLPAGSLQSLALLPGGELLVGSDRGLFVGRESAAGLRFAPHPARLPADTVTRLRVDRHGDLWVGTTSFGLFRISPALG